MTHWQLGSRRWQELVLLFSFLFSNWLGDAFLFCPARTTPCVNQDSKPSAIVQYIHAGCRNTGFRLSAVASSVTSGSTAKTISTETSDVLSLVSIVPNNRTLSPYGVTWDEVFQHLARRLTFVDPKFKMAVIREDELVEGTVVLPQSPTAIFGILLEDERLSSILPAYLASVSNVLFFNSTSTLNDFIRLDWVRTVGWTASFWKRVPKFLAPNPRRAIEVFQTSRDFWDRGHVEDLSMMILVVLNTVVDIPSVSEILKPVGFKALKCMITNCRNQIIACQNNPTCKAALACLDRCAPNDQVCRYRCIVAYESPEFQDFALCILQKHNCLGNKAQIPALPDPAPMATFQGIPLTHEKAEELCFGYLAELKWSWKVVCGQNPAYDFFGCQHQLFYKRKNQMWYDPIFKVKLFDGTEVWRRRHYRVRRAKIPGTFYFSVLDNGVTSYEYWRIVDCAEDLSWLLFFYAGAAAAAGQSYSGAILVTPDGHWPPNRETYIDRLTAALDRAGIKLWELYEVRNEGCEGAPLEFLDTNDVKVEAEA